MSELVPIVPQARTVAFADRTYVCDPLNHCVDVLDAAGQPLFSFGGRGARLGQLHTPTDIAVIDFWPTTEEAPDAGAPMLAVADRGNHRIQLFEADGVAIAAIDGRSGRNAVSPWSARAGWPFFRLATSVPRFSLPARLSWRAPFLEAECAGGRVRVDLAAAMLPEFTEWLDAAPARVLRAALEQLTGDPRERVPDACLLAIVERVHHSHEFMAQTRRRGCA